VAGDIVDAGAGNDKVYGGQGDDFMQLGEGNDFAVGYAGADQIFGGDGIDTIVGDGLYVTDAQWPYLPIVRLDNLRRFDSGDDQLHGGAGNDVLMGQVGNDQLFGDAGNDDLYGDDAAYLGAEVYDPALAATAQDSGRDTLDGGDGDDRLIGGGNDDTLLGGTGNDTLVGDNNMPGVLPQSAHGNDVLDGEDGDDGLFGGGGADLMLGGAGNDRLEGSSDGTVMVDVAYQGNDTLDGGEGHDVLLGGAGNDVLLGGSGDDALSGGSGMDSYAGGAGSDLLVINGAGSHVQFDLGDGFDTIRTGQGVGSVNLELGEGIDPANIIGMRSGNALVMQFNAAGDGLYVEEFFQSGEFLDAATSLGELRFADGTVWNKFAIANMGFKGGEGNDNIVVSVSGAVADGGAGNDVIGVSQEVFATLYGGDGNDVLSISNTGGEVTGGRGDDAIYGSNSLCYGWATMAVFYGAGDGFDLVRRNNEVYADVYLKADLDPSDVYAVRVGDDLQLVIRGQEGGILWDNFYGYVPYGYVQPDIDYLRFQDGSASWNNARIRSEALRNAASLYGSDSVVETVVGSAVADTLIAGAPGSTLQGLGGDDRLVGGAAGDALEGGAGNDLLDGGLGDDVLDGGIGNDLLYGRQGVNTYLLGLGDGVDTVRYSVVDGAGVTHVRFKPGVAVNDVEFHQVGGDLELRIAGTTDKIVLAKHFGELGRLGPGLSGLEQVEFADGTVWDAAHLALLISQISEAPVAGYIPSYGGPEGTPFELTIPSNAFVDVDPGDQLTLSVTAVGDQPLPSWLVFDPLTRTFSGTPGYQDAQDLEVVVRATDLVGHSVTQSLWLYIQDTPQPVDFDGTPGNDTFVGAGSDELVYGSAGDDTLSGAGGVDILHGGDGNDQLMGGDGNDTLNGDADDDVLDGGTGTDQMTGGIGNDTYIVDSATDVIVEAASAGTDTVFSSITRTLAANLENLTLSGGGNINATGNSAANVLTGNTGDNLLDGGAGADTMAGGLGNDTYVVGVATDVVNENLDEGTDLIQSSVNWTLGANVENLALTGTGAINGTGNALGNTLTGNTGVNVLNGGAGADTLLGGLGNDTFVVDNIGDVVTEYLNEGADLVQASVSYTLSANLEKLTLTGTGAINGTGNALNNTLTGNTGNNTLDGGAGIDTMAGGAGNDTYTVDNAADVTTEAASAGTDTVISSISWTLATNLEKLTLSGSAHINATGNTVANVLTGNDGNNVLSGAAGADSMAGGLGNDTYVVDVATDVVTEGLSAGIDLVQAAVTYTLGANLENLTLTGTTAINGTGNGLDNILTGNSGKNILTGGTGNDTLAGGLGNDTLDGGVGSDLIIFNTALGTTNVDTIQNYSVVDDTMQLLRTSFSALPGTGAGTLTAAAFWTGTAAHDADDRIVYDSASGKLWYDADGTGATAAVQFAVLVGLVGTLTSADFLMA
jgi:Ca2+-binding RTX toxin-like protein